MAPAIVVLAVALVLVAVGLRGKRLGTDPYCRTCNYGLTGLTSDACPECGSSILTDGSVVYGRRKRHIPTLVSGVLLAALSGAAVGFATYGHYNKVNWYRYYPAFTLVHKAKTDDAEAIEELISRARDCTLNRDSIGELISVGLVKHGATPAPANVLSWAELLGFFNVDGWLTNEQQNRFYRQLAPAKILVRPKIRQGDWLVISSQSEDRGTSLLPGRLKMRVEDYLIDGETMRHAGPRGDWEDVALGLGRTKRGPLFSSRRSNRRAGKRTIECIVTQALFAPFADPEIADPLWSQQLILQGEVEIASDTDPDPIMLVKNETLVDVLLSAISVQRVFRYAIVDGRPSRLSVSLSLDQPAPMCLAFDAFAVTETGKIAVGIVSWQKGEQGSALVSPSHVLTTGERTHDEIPDSFALELRTSREAASRLLNCDQVWAGTLRFAPIPVATLQPFPTPTRPARRGQSERRHAPRRTTLDPPTGAAGDPALVSWSWQEVPASAVRVARPSTTMSLTDVRLGHADGLPSNQVTAIAQLPDGAMAVGTDAGLCMWRSGTLTTYTSPPASPMDEGQASSNASFHGGRINDLLVSQDGVLWVATRSGLCRMQEDRWTTLVPRLTASGASEFRRIIQERALRDVLRLFETRDGTVVVGSGCAGITFLDPHTQQATTAYYDDDHNHSVRGIAEDSAGELWVGINGLGFARLSGTGLAELVSAGEAWLPIKPQYAYALAIDHADNLWASTPGGLGILAPDGSVSIITSEDILPDGFVLWITARSNGEVWCSTMRGYAVFADGDWSYPVFNDFDASGRTILFEAADGSTWFGGEHGLVRNPTFRLQQQNPVAEALAGLMQQVERDYPDSVPSPGRAIDASSRVYLAFHENLWRYNGADWEDLSDVLKSPRITFVKSDSVGRVWVGTIWQGLFGFAGDDILRFDNTMSGANSTVNDMAEDAGGVLYVGTDGGLYALDGEEWTCLTEWLLPGVHLAPHAVAIDGDGRVWFADVDEGLFMYDGSSIVCASGEGVLKGWQVQDLHTTADGLISASATRRTVDGEAQQTFLCDGQACELTR